MILSKGAEAVIRREDSNVVKERIKKNYRLSQIDEKLRVRRTRLEAGLLSEARRVGVHTPRIIDVRKYEIEMEEVSGNIVKDILNDDNLEIIGGEIGRSVAKLHEYNIVHGDLTTSNMIKSSDGIYFIDFGLGFSSQKFEDKATDLYLLYHSIGATHWNLLEKFWKIILNSYKAHFKEADKVIKTLDQIEKRGRYKKRSESD